MAQRTHPRRGREEQGAGRDLKRKPRAPSLQLAGGIKSLTPLKIPTGELWDSPPAHHLFLQHKTRQHNQNQGSAREGNTRDQPAPGQQARRTWRGEGAGGKNAKWGEEEEGSNNLKAMGLECRRRKTVSADEKRQKGENDVC